MLIKDHKIRVDRLLRGERNVTDLHHLFSDLRMHRPGRPSVKEIGHFAAHRDERNSGISSERANDMQTSARLWWVQKNLKNPTVAHLREAGRANLRIMPETVIKERFGFSHQTAVHTFEAGLRRFSAKAPLKQVHAEVLVTFGLSMMWQYSFHGSDLFSDFVDLLITEGSLKEDQRQSFEPVSIFVNLYALNIMHGARLKLADGQIAQLKLAAEDHFGYLRIKAQIPFSCDPVPMTQSVSMLETSLPARDYCDPKLLDPLGEPIPTEINQERLVLLS